MNSPDKSQPACRIETKEEFLARTSGKAPSTVPACRIETKEEFLARTSGKAPGYGRESGGEHGTEAGVTMSRRKLLFALGGLAVVAAGVTGYKLLETDPIGGELMSEYEKLATPEARHMYVLKQVAAGNMPSTWNKWVTIKVKGPKGTEVEFKASPHGLRVGSNDDWAEFPLSGIHSAAVAEILGCKLATSWMAKATYDQAKSNGRNVHFFDSAEIAKYLGIPWNPNRPDGQKMMSAEFVRARNELLHAWLEEHSIPPDKLIAGYYKSVVEPVAGITSKKPGKLAIIGIGKGKSHRLEIFGGFRDNGTQIQPLSGGAHEETYFDSTHNISLVQDDMKVGGRTMTMDKFFSTAAYATEFGFRLTNVPDRAYPYSFELAKWMKENGHLRFPLEGGEVVTQGEEEKKKGRKAKRR